ncbi:MAG: RNA chaperone Hfq, partial [Proteobacteria bacterium]|nr:RNA chaperone Hfq [Pseudomonadota bacterium]
MTGRTLTARPRQKAETSAETASEAAETTLVDGAAPLAAPAGGAKGQNLQDQFLNLLRKHKTPVTMFLVKGVKLQGIVTWFDNFSILLRRDGQSQLVYKHAVSTIMPSQPV